MAQPSRGEVWSARLSPTVGREQAGDRPVLIISTDGFNHGPASLIFVLPLTRTNRGVPLHVPLEPPEGGLKTTSYVLCDALRSVSKERLRGQAWGRVSPQALSLVEDRLRILLEL